MNVYISGALTGTPNIEELKEFYENIAEVCTDLGLKPYLPHLNSDPKKHPDISASKVYEMDAAQIKNADLVVAYIGMPSLGVGAEIEIAHYSNIPVIILYESEKPVSRMSRGNPAVIRQIIFDHKTEALEKLKLVLENFKPKENALAP